MIITNAQYVSITIDEVATNVGINANIDGVDVHVGIDPLNRHYAEIMRQVKAGTLTIEPADE